MRRDGKKGKAKWVVIAIVVIFIIAIASDSGDGDDKKESQKVGSISDTGKSAKKTSDKSNKKKKSKSKNSQKDDGKYHPGDVVQFGDFEIAYISAEKYKSTNQFIQPQDGYKYVRFVFNFLNKGNTDNYPGSFGCYVNNQKCNQEYLSDADNSFFLQELSAGREKSGSVIFEVPKKAKMKDIELEYENNSIWSDKKIIFLGK